MDLQRHWPAPGHQPPHRAPLYPFGVVSRSPRVSILDSYQPYLLKRWNGGCHTDTVLYEEIKQRGYRGKRSHVLAYITRLRKAQGLPPRSRMLTPGDAVLDEAAHRLTPRQATWLVLDRQQDQEAQQKIHRLRTADAALEEAIELAQGFAHLVRERLGAHLDAWLAQEHVADPIDLKQSRFFHGYTQSAF